MLNTLNKCYNVLVFLSSLFLISLYLCSSLWNSLTKIVEDFLVLEGSGISTMVGPHSIFLGWRDSETSCLMVGCLERIGDVCSVDKSCTTVGGWSLATPLSYHLWGITNSGKGFERCSLVTPHFFPSVK